MPCATQNEVSEKDAEALVKAGVSVLCEGANMPCRSEAIDVLHENKVEFGPAKAANAGTALPCIHTQDEVKACYMGSLHYFVLRAG